MQISLKPKHVAALERLAMDIMDDIKQNVDALLVDRQPQCGQR